jgi:hypothetical protein
MSSKFEKGLAFQSPIYVHTMANPLVFSDHPCCEKVREAWEQRKLRREAMDDKERLQDVIKNGYFPVSVPNTYSRSCKCTSCRAAFMATFFKGILTRPRGWWELELDPKFTREGFQKRFQELAALTENKPTQAEKISISKARESIKNDESGVFLFNVNKSMFQAISFAVVQALWSKCVQDKVYYDVDPEKSHTTKHPQPSWTLLANIDEVANLQREPVLYDEVIARRVLLVNAHGPFTEAQAMLVFGPIRSAANKGAVVVVNSDDPTLRDYVLRLHKNLE